MKDINKRKATNTNITKHSRRIERGDNKLKQETNNTKVVESVWWQALAPHMNSPAEYSLNNKTAKLLGPSLGDQNQGSFSVDLWTNAFWDASKRLCPVRAEGHHCGCLSVVTRLVMRQCVARLDVECSMLFSDPILDSRVLPILTGDLSFGSGAQLKNFSNVERKLSAECLRSFPYTAAPVVYNPPSSVDVLEKDSEAGERSPLETNVSDLRRKGNTSDEEMDEVSSPLSAIVDKLPL